MNTDERIVRALFDTKALRISSPDQPFFYTSGTIGPYYINTHFLYGSEAEAQELLTKIEAAVRQPEKLTALLLPLLMKQYEENSTYRLVIDALSSKAAELPHDIISGGERRDFIFSLPVAQLSGNPHLSILKSGEVWFGRRTDDIEYEPEKGELAGQQVLHISDLVTAASSYTRTWIPAVTGTGATMPHTLTVVDRDQGGKRALASVRTTLHALTTFSAELFETAANAGLVTKSQLEQILSFFENPTTFESKFLAEHPNFLKEQIALGGKNAERARLVQERLRHA